MGFLVKPMAEELCQWVEGKVEEQELEFEIKQAPSDCKGIQINEDLPNLNELSGLIAG